ncbi:MAG TPA: DinB family protein [Acidimicrobiales bacterium]|nr:DinB family protein [Acidimicrobiales bacterium]
MPETPPQLRVARPDEAVPFGEMPMARAWLQHLRDSAIYKVEGLTPEQLRWQPAPTANSLGVLVVHLGYAERLWLRAICAGEPMDMGWRAHMFELPDGWGAAEAVAFYRAESALADAVLDRATSLDLPSVGDLRPTTLRWAVFHLIEETARHVGHMDITRELVDGSVGR